MIFFFINVVEKFVIKASVLTWFYAGSDIQAFTVVRGRPCVVDREFFLHNSINCKIKLLQSKNIIWSMQIMSTFAEHS